MEVARAGGVEICVGDTNHTSRDKNLFPILFDAFLMFQTESYAAGLVAQSASTEYEQISRKRIPSRDLPRVHATCRH